MWFAYHIAIVMGIDGVYEGDMFFYGVSLGVIIWKISRKGNRDRDSVVAGR